MDANVLGTWLYCKYAGKVMEQGRGGKVILVSSTRGKLGMKNYTAYSPSKAAVDLMTKSLACEWGEYGINVNAIGPTVFRSSLRNGCLTTIRRARNSRASRPAGWESRKILSACIFLASAASDFITGTTVYVDGGYLADKGERKTACGRNPTARIVQKYHPFRGMVFFVMKAEKSRAAGRRGKYNLKRNILVNHH